MIFEICVATDIGCMRQKNEDGFYINNMGCYNSNNCFLYKQLEAPIFAFVADGVGGSEVGGEATRLCVETALSEPTPYDDTDLIGLIEKVNFNVCRVKNTIDTACTLAGVLIGEDSVYWFDIGDSKVYTVSYGFLNQLSVDDTISGLSGEISEEKEPLIQYIGKSSIMPHIGEVEGLSCYLICTDGLTDMISLDEMEELINNTSDIKRLVSSLIDCAKEKGGLDNITIIVIKPLKEEKNG